MVEPQPSKLVTAVRICSPAPFSKAVKWGLFLFIKKDIMPFLPLMDSRWFIVI